MELPFIKYSKSGDRRLQERLWEIDVLRTFACLAVILIHVTAEVIFSGSPGKLMVFLLSFINVSCKFAVPAFIFMSGLILYYRYRDEAICYRKFWQRRLSFVLIPYFFWTFVYYGAFVVSGYQSFSLKFLLKKLLLGDMVYHLYFVVIIVQFYLLFGVFKFMFNRYNSHLVLVLMGILNILFLKLCSFNYIDRFFMRYIFFYALGFYFIKNYDRLKSELTSPKTRWFLGAVYLGLGVFSTNRYYHNFVLGGSYNTFTENLLWLLYSFVSILFYYGIAWSIKYTAGTVSSEFIANVSDSSYYIYLAHPLALYVCPRILKYLSLNSTLLRFIIICSVVFFSVFPVSFWYQNHKKQWGKRLRSLWS